LIVAWTLLEHAEHRPRPPRRSATAVAVTRDPC
jgi:hypothetical protein